MMRYVLLVVRAIVIARLTAHGLAPSVCWATDNHILLLLAARS